MVTLPSRPLAIMLVVSVVVVGGVGGMTLANGFDRVGRASSGPGGSAPATGIGGTSGQSPSPAPTLTPDPTVSPTPTPDPSPAPDPTPTLVAAAMTGRLVTIDVAQRHPIAVMIDDQADARPQSGLNAASVVWQAPAEGGIPRYMAIYQENVPQAVGPVRSARSYFIAWAAEWRAMYVHAGGSPQALETLRASGAGQLVYDADQFRYGTRYLWRIASRPSPHNVYTDGDHLRQLATLVKATDGPLRPAWTFAPDVPFPLRPVGGRIDVTYPANRIRYDYDRLANTYRRSVTSATPEVDAADGEVVAPRNVVIMVVRFSPLNDGQPEKDRLAGQVIGSGPAWIATNGKTVKGTWRKTSLTSPTQLLGAAGQPISLTIGQTFVQVVGDGSTVTIADGSPAPEPTPQPTREPMPARVL